MKRSVVLMILLTGAVLATALVAVAAPKFIHYQGYLTDGSGNPVPDTPPLSIRFAIYNDIGDSLWGETKTVSTNNGKFNVKLGEDNDFPKDLFFDEDRWLGIKVGTDAEMTPRTLLGSVPYAFMAGNVPDTSIGSGKIKKNSIVDSLIADTTIGKSKIKHKSIIDSLIADTTIGKDKIKHKSIIDSLIADTTIGKDKIRNKAIVDSLIDDTTVVSRHIRKGAVRFEHIAQNDAEIGQVMKWDGDSWEHADDDVGMTDNDWELVGNALYTSDEWGIARAGNTLYGINDSTHVNFGVACTTGYNLGDYKYITVSGGIGNKAEGEGSVIAGGGGIGTMGGNWITGDYCVIGGGSDNFAGDAAPGSGVPFCATIAGGRHNFATGRFSVVSGGGGEDDEFGNSAFGDHAVISGGGGNQATGQYSVVGGGGNNLGQGNTAQGDYSVIGGGAGNLAGGGGGGGGQGTYSTVSGGYGNSASAQYTAIGGGYNNVAGGLPAGAGDYATVGGGSHNQATGIFSVVAGGGGNAPAAEGNIASGEYSVVGGGQANQATGAKSTIGGGVNNTAGDSHSTVGGGINNTADGVYSTVPGGYGNSALASNSFAAGYQATVQSGHNGTFVWSDGSAGTFSSTAPYQFLIRADNGVGINTNSPTQDLDVDGNARIRNMPSGSGNSVRIDGTGVLYQQSSSRRHKDNIRDLTIDASPVLQLNPVTFSWKSTGDDDFGLIAEDVAELLPQLVVYDSLGRPNGVKYDQLSVYLLGVVKQQQAAIDRLNEQVTSNAALEAQVSQLRALVEVLLAERNQSSGGSHELVMGK
ncbi:MAG: tail fiber domain-containing protein [bacterium]